MKTLRPATRLCMGCASITPPIGRLWCEACRRGAEGDLPAGYTVVRMVAGDLAARLGVTDAWVPLREGRLTRYEGRGTVRCATRRQAIIWCREEMGRRIRADSLPARVGYGEADEGTEQRRAG